MKILMLPGWLPNRLEVNHHGAARSAASPSFFIEQADDLHRHTGIRIDVLIPRIYSWTKLLRLRKMPVFGSDVVSRQCGEIRIGYYPYLFNHSRPLNWRRFGERLYNDYVATHGAPDVVWAGGFMWCGFLANHLMREHDVPYFVVEHVNGQVMETGTKKSRRVKGELERIAREALFVAAPCSFSARRMKAFFGGAAGEIRVVTNTLFRAFENLPPLRERASGGEFVFHNTARLDGNKNHFALLAAFGEICRDFPDAKLNIAGDGVDYGRIKKQIRDIRLEGKAVLLGNLGRDELAMAMLQAHAFVAASISETFNIALIEALSCGLPCVATPTGVAEDAICAQNGVVVAGHGADDLLAGMRHVRANYACYDSQAIRQRALARFSGAGLARQLKALFEETAPHLAPFFDCKTRREG